MFSQTDLQQLLSFDANSAEVLSLYLDTDTGQQPMETIKLQVRGLLREAGNGFGADAKAIERFLDHAYDWSKPGLALFSCQKADYFAAYPTAVAFRNRVRVGRRPYVKPLTHLLDHYAHYGVIVVDRVGGRFFEFHLGELQSTGGALGEEVRKVKRGRGSSATGMRGGVGGARNEEELAQRNLRDIAAEAEAFFADKDIRRLFLGGTTETVAQFREMLSKQLQSCIAGTFPIEKYANEHEVRERTLAQLRTTNEQREKALVAQVLTAAGKGANGVTGLDDVLQAVCDGRVQHLIISDGFRAPGYKAPDQPFIIANLAKSPLSDRQLQEVPDVVEEAVALALAHGGHVEVIADNPDLEAAGYIGALLRY